MIAGYRKYFLGRFTAAVAVFTCRCLQIFCRCFLNRLLIVVAVCALALYGLKRFDASRVGPTHYYPTNTPESVLTEESALEAARKAMQEEGYDLSQWRIRPVPSIASRPVFNGRQDRILLRQDSMSGEVMFENPAESLRQRGVFVTLKGKMLTVYIYKPK